MLSEEHLDSLILGKIEKLFSTYGFVAVNNGQRYFFHFGTCITKPEFFKVGDMVSFSLGEDSKTRRLHAQKLRKILLDSCHQRSANLELTELRMPPSALKRLSTASNYVASTGKVLTKLNTLSTRPYDILLGACNESSKPTEMATSGTGIKVLDELQLRHSTVSLDCSGLILLPPQDTAGIIACVIAGVPKFVEFHASDLKYKEERCLIKFGTSISFMAVWMATTGVWSARQVMPVVDVSRGLLSLVDRDTISVDFLTSSDDRRLVLPISNVCFLENQSANVLIDKARCNGGVLVTFVDLSNLVGQPILTRMGSVQCTFNATYDECQTRSNLRNSLATVFSSDSSSSDESSQSACSIVSTDGCSLFTPSFSPQSPAHKSSQYFIKNEDVQKAIAEIYVNGTDCLNVGLPVDGGHKKNDDFLWLKTNRQQESKLSNSIRPFVTNFTDLLPTTVSQNSYEKARDAWYSLPNTGAVKTEHFGEPVLIQVNSRV